MSAAQHPPAGRSGPGAPAAWMAWLRGDDGRTLGACIFAAIVVALMTGTSGNAQHLTAGVTGSLFKPRVIVFLALGVALWLAIVSWRRYGSNATEALGAVRTVRTRVGGNRLAQYGGYLAVLLVAILVPPQLSVFWQQVLVSQIGIFVLLTIGLNVVVGFAGLLDLGYIAFYAIGAYTAAYLTGYPDSKRGHISPLPVHPPVHLNPFLVFPFAVLACLIAGLLLGAPTLRLRGDYLAIVTLGFGEIVYSIALIKTDVTGGDSGAFNIPHFAINIGGAHYKWGVNPLPYYWLLLIFIAFVFIVFRRLEHTRTGRAWAAIREDEVAAAASGVPTVRYKLLAFAIGASTSGFAGVLYAANVNFINPASFVLQQSILVLVLVIFGGMGSMWGVIAGAAVLEWLPEALRSRVPASDRFIYYGLLIILMMIFRPQGLIPSRRRTLEIKQAEAGLGEGDAMGLPKEMQS
jgi:branched-chain amino acid transport system permease protein